jgi:L,D-transpeptidase ErfK/SrfK
MLDSTQAVLFSGFALLLKVILCYSFLKDYIASKMPLCSKNIMPFTSKYKTLFLTAALLELLTGCQYLPRSAISSSSFTTPSYSSVETHNFSVDYEQNLIGALAAIRTQTNDTLPDIARHFGLGHNDIIAANPTIDPWVPTPNSHVLLPLLFTLPDVPHEGIVLNLANMRLFHFPSQQSEQVKTYPVGIGRDGWNTPLGLTQIISKTKNPTWYVPASIQKEHAQKGDPLPSSVPSGSNNPLGEYAMRLALSQYLIHVTNKPYGVGMQMSHGCVNLYPEDIRTLFDNTAVGTQVMIVDQPYLLGWHHDMLFLEAHKPLHPRKSFKSSLMSRIRLLAKQQRLTIDWTKVEQVLQQANGIPTPILMQSMSLQELSANAMLLPHPESFFGQPVVRDLTANDWTVTAATLNDEKMAQKLSAIINHQGPPIPTRVLQKEGLYQVVSGPFASDKEVYNALKRIRLEFELEGRINPPQTFSGSRYLPQNLKSIPNLYLPNRETSFFENWFN